jgi:hypothetical protein
LSTKIEHHNKKDNKIDWCRNKVLELSSQGHTQRDIAQILHVSIGIVNNDLTYLRNQAQENLKTHINERLPEQYQNCITGMKQVLRLSWEIANSTKSANNNDNSQTATTMTTTDDKTRLQALALINDCYKYIRDLTTNGIVITDV